MVIQSADVKKARKKLRVYVESHARPSATKPRSWSIIFLERVIGQEQDRGPSTSDGGDRGTFNGPFSISSRSVPTSK